MNLGRLIIDIAANTAELKTGLTDARKELGSFKGSVEGTIASVTKMGGELLKGFGVFVTVRELANQVKETVHAFEDAERASLRLNAVLRATGNTAGISADELKKMAQELSNSSLFKDNDILAAISQLETFDNISGETFKQAIKLSIDLASVWDEDLSTSAFALGKALQSPADAATLLARSKIRLTEEEKKTIEQFVRMNDVAGAQKTLLKALQDRVGGVAGDEASGLAGAFHRLGNKIEEARKNLVGFFGELFSGSGVGLSDVIATALGKGSGLMGPKPATGPLKLGDMPDVFTQNPEQRSKEVADLLTLANTRTGTSPWNEIRQITASDISRLKELAKADSEALATLKLDPETRARLVRELKAIQDALDSLHGGGSRGGGLNTRFGFGGKRPAPDGALDRIPVNAWQLGALGDPSRKGTTPEDEAAMRAALADPARNGGLAMRGIGGAPGSSPLRDERTAQAAALWRETWINAIRGTQEAFTNFFDSIGQKGWGLAKLLEDIARVIQHTLSEIASQKIVNAIFTGVLGGISGPGGQTTGNLTQSQGMSSSVGTTSVHQSITFNAGFVDAGSGDAWLRSKSGTIAGVVMDAATAAPRFARHIVSQGTR